MNLPAAVMIAAVMVAATLAPQARADGVGWWYYSFSAEGFTRFFGGGSAEDRVLVERFIRDLFASGSLEANFGHVPTEDNLRFWLSRAQRGLKYARLSDAQTLRHDELLHAVMNGPNVPLIDVEPEVGRHYLQPDVLEEAARWTSKSSLLRLFEYGRSYGAERGRSSCLLSSVDHWWCERGYVILSTEEVRRLHEEIRSILKAPTLSEPARIQLGELETALVRVRDRRRSMYFVTGN